MAQNPRPRLRGARRGGWFLVCHPAFRDPLSALAEAVARMREQGIFGWEATPRAKLLKRVLDIMLTEVPANPASPAYELGNSLGADARGWRRVKFLGRMRLFFRFDTASKVIVYGWVNDANTLRKAGASTDPYTVFRGMLIDGHPPHDWDALLDACREPADAPRPEGIGGLFDEGLDRPEPAPIAERVRGRAPKRRGR